MRFPKLIGRRPNPTPLLPLFEAAGGASSVAQLLGVSRWTLWRWNKKSAIPRAYQGAVNAWCRHFKVKALFPKITEEEIRLSEEVKVRYNRRLAPDAPERRKNVRVSKRNAARSRKTARRNGHGIRSR